MLTFIRRSFLLPVVVAGIFALFSFAPAQTSSTTKDVAIATQAASVVGSTIQSSLPSGLSSDPATAFQQGVSTATQVYMNVRPTLPPTTQTYGDLAVTIGVLLAGILGLFVHKSTVTTLAASNTSTHSQLISSLASSVPASSVVVTPPPPPTTTS